MNKQSNVIRLCRVLLATIGAVLSPAILPAIGLAPTSASMILTAQEVAIPIESPAQAPDLNEPSASDATSVDVPREDQSSSEALNENAATTETAPTGWTLEQLIGRALSVHPAVVERQALISAAQGNMVQVGLQNNPNIGYEGQQLGSRGLAEQEGISIGQEIIRPGKLQRNRAIAAAEVDRARQELAIIQQRISTDVHVAFFELIAANRQVELTTELLSIAKQGASAAQQLLDAKEVGRADLLQAQLEVENAEILAQNAKNRAIAAWQSLASIASLTPNCPENVLGTLELESMTFEFCQVLDRLRTASPEIAVAVATIERARAVLERERFEPRPNVSVQGLVNWRDNGIGGSSDGGVAVSVPVPLWNKNQGAIREAISELRAAEQALARLELDLQQRLAPVFERYANALNQVQRYRERILPAATESLDLTRRAYQEGEVSFVTVLTAQRTYFENNVGYLNSLRELRVAESEIDGLLLTGSLR